MKFYKKRVIYLPSVWGGVSSGPVWISVDSTRNPVSVFWGYCYEYQRPADTQQKVASYSTGGWEVARSPAGAASGEACFLVASLPASSPCPGSMAAHSLLT